MKGDKLKDQLKGVVLQCTTDYIKNHPELLKSATSASVSMSMSMSMSSISITDSQVKIGKALAATQTKARNILKKAMAELGLASLRLFRGTQCALCMDPDAPIEGIWKNGAAQVKDSDVTEIKSKVKKQLLDSLEGSKLSIVLAKADYLAVLTRLECKAGIDMINNFKPEDTLCKDDASCQTLADGAVTSAWTVKNDPLVGEMANSRVLQASSLAGSPTGISGQTSDAEDDTIVTVDGKSVSGLNSEIAAADTEIKANPVDLDKEITEQAGAGNQSSIIFFAISMMAIISVLLI